MYCNSDLVFISNNNCIIYPIVLFMQSSNKTLQMLLLGAAVQVVKPFRQNNMTVLSRRKTRPHVTL